MLVTRMLSENWVTGLHWISMCCQIDYYEIYCQILEQKANLDSTKPSTNTFNYHLNSYRVKYTILAPSTCAAHVSCHFLQSRD